MQNHDTPSHPEGSDARLIERSPEPTPLDLAVAEAVLREWRRLAAVGGPLTVRAQAGDVTR